MTANKSIRQNSETGETPLSVSDVLYTRTDQRGIIKACNADFRRVSGYDIGRLMGAPHRIVRSPEMPKAIFWLMWKSLQAGKPFAAFLKNKTASGTWYWTISVITPAGDGFLAGHINPTGRLFDQIKSVYAEVLAAEQAQSLLPDKSGDLFLRRLSEDGFQSYTDFMTLALDQELSSRDATHARVNIAQGKALSGVAVGLQSTQKKQESLLHEFDALQSIPTNMRIIASRLEPTGGPISAISDNYKFASSEISRRMDAFTGVDSNLCKLISDVVGETTFLSGVQRLLAEISRQMKAGNASDASASDLDERDLLAHLRSSFSERTRGSMTRAEQAAGELNLAASEVRRMMLGLDTIRVMGRVESGRLGASGEGLASTIDQLDTRHAGISGHLQGLMDLSAGIKSGINAYQRLSSSF